MLDIELFVVVVVVFVFVFVFATSIVFAVTLAIGFALPAGTLPFFSAAWLTISQKPVSFAGCTRCFDAVFEATAPVIDDTAAAAALVGGGADGCGG